MIRRGRRLRTGIVLVSVGIVIVVILAGIQIMEDGVEMKTLFASEVQAELGKTKFSSEVFTTEELAGLPEPVQRYFRYSGFIGRPKMSTARIVFNNVAFKNGNKDLKLYSEQFNFVQEPARIVYLNSRLLGVIPFEGRDKYQNGQGYMTGRLAKLIKLFDVTGSEMHQSALVTILAEALVVPNYALQDYITWEEIDEHHAQATIEYKGVKASGIFTINDVGEFVTFTTKDRYMDQGKGVMALVPWTVEIIGYHEQNEVMVPIQMKATWEMPEGDLVYFDGVISSIEYNVRDL